MDDSAMFQCLASNEAGEKSSYTWLKVKSKLKFVLIYGYFHISPGSNVEKKRYALFEV